MQSMRRYRVGTVLTATIASAFALTISAIPANASTAPQAPASARGTASGNVSSKAIISAEAWAAGRAKFGAQSTAAQAIDSYWTPERMRAAKPIEDSPAYLRAIKAYDEKTKAAMERAQREPNRPAPPAVQSHQVAPRAGLLGAGAKVPAAHKPNYDYRHITARTNGKVYFDMNGVSGWQCSAAVVNSEGLNSVWTAGHCLNEGGGSGHWASNWKFVPSFNDDLANPRPYGTWYAAQIFTRTAWANNSDFAEDMGVAIMEVNSGNHIAGYLGGQGIITGVGRRVWENAFGYPAEAPFDGGNLYQCWGTSEPEQENLFGWSETTHIPCDMTRGSSGGPWLYNWNGELGYLNGINSRIDRIVNPTIMLSPYFDDTAWALYNDTRYR
jgi:hypothetical protein